MKRIMSSALLIMFLSLSVYAEKKSDTAAGSDSDTNERKTATTSRSIQKDTDNWSKIKSLFL